MLLIEHYRWRHVTSWIIMRRRRRIFFISGGWWRRLIYRWWRRNSGWWRRRIKWYGRWNCHIRWYRMWWLICGVDCGWWWWWSESGWCVASSGSVALSLAFASLDPNWRLFVVADLQFNTWIQANLRFFQSFYRFAEELFISIHHVVARLVDKMNNKTAVVN